MRFPGMPKYDVLSEHDDEGCIEFELHSGRLRLYSGSQVIAELSPPHSWEFVASTVAGSDWGTRPRQQDLLRVLPALRRSVTSASDDGHMTKFAESASEISSRGQPKKAGSRPRAQELTQLINRFVGWLSRSRDTKKSTRFAWNVSQTERPAFAAPQLGARVSEH